MAKDLDDAVYGCLIGGAIGDALGAPVEGWHYTDIRAQFGRLTNFLPSSDGAIERTAGHVTDDSTLRHYMCLAIVRKGGRITPDDYAQIWLEKLSPDRLFMTERIVLEKLRLGISPWDSGRGQLSADAAAMSIAPIGIINAGDPDQAYQDGFNIALIHQDGFERDAAAALSAAFAAAYLPDANVDSVLATLARYGSYELRRLLNIALDMAATSGDIDAFAELFYANLLDTSFPVPPGQEWELGRSPSPTSREVVPAAAAILSLCHGDPNRSIVEAASFGRDCDTIATIVGGLTGALMGASALRTDWIDACEQANEDLFIEMDGDSGANFRVMAQRLVEAIRAERRRLQDRLELLDRIIQ